MSSETNLRHEFLKRDVLRQLEHLRGKIRDLQDEGKRTEALRQLEDLKKAVDKW